MFVDCPSLSHIPPSSLLLVYSHSFLLFPVPPAPSSEKKTHMNLPFVYILTPAEDTRKKSRRYGIYVFDQ